MITSVLVLDERGFIVFYALEVTACKSLAASRKP
jgi:hypothetical protein